NYFLDKNLREKMNEEEILRINEYLKKFLLKILEENLMLPISVLQIINERNNDIPLEIISPFMEKALEKQVESLENSSKNIDMYTNQINETNKKITELNTNAIVFNLNLCDECDTPVIQRTDDNPDTYEERYNTYMNKTAPLIDYYSNRNIVYHIDASGTVDETHAQVKKVIGE
ncbi:MAG: hypothetical protein J6W64_01010, partial [Bacilli bacterium]|nr:hypothetical protein [Bacilli bacterium]